MIFAADLDRTLLFSQRRLEGDAAVIPVEYRFGEPFGFMTPGGFSALRTLQKQAVCFVNTLRGLEQANRVVFVSDGSCRYLSLQNGLYLYRDGKEDSVWAAHVKRTVHALPLHLTDGAGIVLKQLPGIQCLSKQYEYLAVFFVEDESFDDRACSSLAAELSASGWALYRQRKKLYLYPQALDKGAVLERVRELEGCGTAVGFGDSWFDVPMLRACDAAWSLKGCELEGTDWGFPIQYSSLPAQAGTEQVLTRILTGLGEGYYAEKS